MNSIWTETVELKKYSPLKEDKKTKVLVIGGGMAGLLCAYRLAEKGVDYVLVEADRIGRGMTGNTTAKLTSQHGLIYQDIVHKYGVEKALMYYHANELAIRQFGKLSEKAEFDFEQKDSFVYTLNDYAKMEKELKALERMGVQGTFISTTRLPFQIAGAVKFGNQAQFHPLKFIKTIAEQLNIYEKTMVQKVVRQTGGSQGNYQAFTEHGTITADKVIVATHFPFINRRGLYFLKLYQSRSYVVAVGHDVNAEGSTHTVNSLYVDGMFVDEKETGLSFRNYGNLLFIGGADHRTGEKSGDCDRLKDIAGTYYPEATEQYRWMNQDCMSLDKLPYIGQYSPHTPNLYVATGFNKWGMTLSMAAADMIVDDILGKKNEFAEVFAPNRTMLHKQLAVNGWKATANLLTISGKRCPHMGCAMKWNEKEKRWDCPCHGSSFQAGGRLRNNPAMKDLK